jgi:3-hydroxyisobutyrate dehydrogenase-like beta-hydroxyacid dehydrogenase
VNLQLLVTNQVSQLLQELIEGGGGDLDHSAVINAIDA